MPKYVGAIEAVKQPNRTDRLAVAPLFEQGVSAAEVIKSQSYGRNA